MKQMEYKVQVEPIPEEASKGKLNIDSTIVYEMSIFKIREFSCVENVPKECLNAYMHKLDMLITYGVRDQRIDTLNE